VPWAGGAREDVDIARQTQAALGRALQCVAAF
jgi:hypothetical protein